MHAVRCSTPGCSKPMMVGQAYCALCLLATRMNEALKPAPATTGWPDPMANLPDELKAMVPGNQFKLSFYGRPQRFLFEAWDGHYLIARPDDQVWATVRIPLADLTRFGANRDLP